MSILEVFRSKFPSLSMREAQSLLEQDSSIRLIDVRTPKEYAAGHIPRSRNVPLDRISGISSVEPNKDAKLFVYCLSGGRSKSACSALVNMGYTNVTNIGGISSWSMTTASFCPQPPVISGSSC